MANVPEADTPVAGIILAAGLGRRMGGDKLLLPWHGRPLIRHVAENAVSSRLADVSVVVGYRAAAIAGALHDLPVRIVHNPEYAAGQSTSLRAGIANLMAGMAGAMIMLADQPRLTTATIDAMVTAFHEVRPPIVAACSGTRRGNPVLFARTLFPDLMTIKGDQGARGLLAVHQSNIHCIAVDAGIFEDIDTPEAYAALQRDDR